MSILPADAELPTCSPPRAFRGARASGVGSWPGVDVREATRTVRDVLVRDGCVPYLPELPGRGPGAEMVGRGCSLLVELPTELTPYGWRIAAGRARDSRRAQAYLREDVERLAEELEGYTGPLKTQIIGPWTLAAALELPRGEKVLSDLGAVRDLVQSLRAGLRDHVATLARLLPSADLIVQIDEPSLTAVLDGRIASASKLRRLAPIDAGLVQDTLRNEVACLTEAGAQVVIHSCAPNLPLGLLSKTQAHGVALDTSLLTPEQFDDLGTFLDSGRTLWAGCVPTTSSATHPGQIVEGLRDLLARVGWSRDATNERVLDQLVLTPACGLGVATPADAIRLQRLSIDAASMLNDER